MNSYEAPESIYFEKLLIFIDSYENSRILKIKVDFTWSSIDADRRRRDRPSISRCSSMYWSMQTLDPSVNDPVRERKSLTSKTCV